MGPQLEPTAPLSGTETPNLIVPPLWLSPPVAPPEAPPPLELHALTSTIVATAPTAPTAIVVRAPRARIDERRNTDVAL